MNKQLKGTLIEITRSQDNGTFRRDANLAPRDLMSLSAIDSKLRNFEKEPVMNIEKTEVDTIDMTPSWKCAVRIYCAVLQNPDADQNAKNNAEADLMNLADAMDKVIADNKKALEKIS